MLWRVLVRWFFGRRLRRARGSPRWPRRRGRGCGSARCRTAARGCRAPIEARPAGRSGRAPCVRRRAAVVIGAQEHSVSSKLASLPLGLRRPSASWRISRIEHHQAVAADLGHQLLRRVDAHAQQQVSCAPPAGSAGTGPRWRPPCAARRESRSRPSSTCSASASGISGAVQPRQVGAAARGVELLPGVVGRQVELAGAAGNADAAADAHQPLVGRQRVPCLARAAG